MVHRLFNAIAAAVGIILLSPLLAILGILVKTHDHGTIFYRARRVGKDGKLIDVLKFRTMCMNADKLGAGLTSKADGRITRPGGFLRRFKLDELPQLWNVLTGTMNLVGPRPEDPRYVAQYTPEQRQILTYRPGMTSPASLAYRNEEEYLAGPESEELYLRELLPKKLAMDMAYCRRQTVWGDVVLIVKTIVSAGGKSARREDQWTMGSGQWTIDNTVGKETELLKTKK